MPQALLLSGCHLLIALTAAGSGDDTPLHLLLNQEARLCYAGWHLVRAQRQLALRRKHCWRDGIAACRCDQTGIGKVQLPHLQAGSLHTANCLVTMRARHL